jgi:hypothetical protein
VQDVIFEILLKTQHFCNTFSVVKGEYTDTNSKTKQQFNLSNTTQSIQASQSQALSNALKAVLLQLFGIK